MSGRKTRVNSAFMDWRIRFLHRIIQENVFVISYDCLDELTCYFFKRTNQINYGH